jgi:chromosome partitioning protein
MRIAIVNLKGGVGKTTTAVYLGAALAKLGPTLLVDADEHRSALSWSERVGEEFPCSVVALPVRDIHKRLQRISGQFEHVIVDTPPNDAAIARSAVLASQVVVVPISPSTMDMDRLADTFQLIAEVESSHEMELFVLITRARTGTRLAREVRIVLDEMNAPVLAAQVPLAEVYASGFGASPTPETHYQAVLEELSR